VPERMRVTGRGEQREGMEGIPILVERCANLCASTVRKGVANRSENTEPEIAVQPARRVPAFERIGRSSPISEFQFRVSLVFRIDCAGL